MRQVQIHTLNPETQDSTVCASQPSVMHTFFQVKTIIEEVLDELTETVCVSNLTRRKSDEAQITAFHLRHRETNGSLKVSWNVVDLENTAQPK